MNEFRKLLIDTIGEEINNSNSVALLFSGGTDSLTCLFSLLELNIRPVLYTFHLEGIIHKDIEISKKVSQYYQLSHKIIEIKRDLEQLKKDVCHLINKYQIYRKTNVQCTYPFLYVLPKIKEENVVIGLCADDLYGTAKSVAIKASKNKEVFDKIRTKIFSDLNSSSYRAIKEMTENTFGKKFIAPYRKDKIFEYFMRFSWEELNKPKQKQLSLNAFEDYFNRQKIYRKNNNLQIGSKIREWHDELLNTDLNKNKRNRVDELYKDIFRGDITC